MARRWRLFFYLVGPPLIVLFAAVPAMLLLVPRPVPVFAALACLLPLGLAVLFLYGLADAIRGRILITPTSVVKVGLLGQRQLDWVEIKGFQIGQNYLRLLPTDTLRQPLKISLLTEQMPKIIDWVAEYYPNLEPPSQAAEAPFASPETQSTRDRQRAEARQTARLLNHVSWIVTAWLLFYPTPYGMAVLAALLLPLAAVAAQWLYPGMLRPDEPDAAPAPSLAVSLLIPGVGLFVRMLLDAELVSVAAVQPWAYPVGGGFALLLLAGSWRHLVGKNRELGQLVIILASALLYGFSAPVAYNVAFDTGRPTYYSPLLLRKYINGAELPGFTAQLQPWGPFRAPAPAHVSRAYYRQLRPGSPVRVRLMPGALGMPWFRVVENSPRPAKGP